MYRPLRLCSHGGGFEALPESPRQLDLGQVRAALESAGVGVVDARVMLIASLDPEVTISRSGRLLFKTPDGEVAQGAFDRLLALVPQLEASPAPRARPER
jgi:hypothetical protein